MKTATATFSLPELLFGRLVSLIDRALDASARVALRNGDVPPFGL